MDITLNTCEWTEVTELEDGKMYALQAKYIRNGFLSHTIYYLFVELLFLQNLM